MFALKTSKAARDINRRQLDHVEEHRERESAEIPFIVIENLFRAVIVYGSDKT